MLSEIIKRTKNVHINLAPLEPKEQWHPFVSHKQLKAGQGPELLSSAKMAEPLTIYCQALVINIFSSTTFVVCRLLGT